METNCKSPTYHPKTGDNSTAGQKMLTTGTYLWLILLVLLWATNSVVVKIAVRDIPPFWSAFFRFAPALPFITLFIRRYGNGFKLTMKEFLLVSTIGIISAVQIFTFNFGSQFTTGGRITLFIFSYPLAVTLLAPLFIKEERLEKKRLIGCLFAFAGLVIAFHGNQAHDLVMTAKGDVIELASCLLIAIKLLSTKRLASSIDKWKILFWAYVIMIFCFWAGAVTFEDLHMNAVRPDAWAVIGYQSLVISVFCFMSWQYLIVRHNSSSVSVFFFATPLLGMIIAGTLFGEAFESKLIIACILVGFGIYIVNRERR